MSNNYQSLQMQTGDAPSDISVEEHTGNGISVKQTGGTTVVNQDGSVSSRGFSSSGETEAPTFLNKFGNPSASFDPEGSVQIGGMTVASKVAERMGYISKDQGGNTQVNKSAVANDSALPLPPAEQTAEEASQDLGLNPQELANLDDQLSELDDHALSAVSASAIGALATSGDLTKAIERYAQTTGAEPAEAEAKVLQAVQPFFDAGARYLETKVGLPASDHEQFLDYCRTEQPQQLREAFEAITQKNSYIKLGRMVDGFTRNTTPSLEALDNHGIEHRQANNRTQVKLNNQWVDLVAARRSALI